MAARASEVGSDRRRSATVSRPFLYVARRIDREGRPFAFLRAAVAESELARYEAPSRRRLTLLAVGMGLLVGLLLVVVRRRHALDGRERPGERPVWLFRIHGR